MTCLSSATNFRQSIMCQASNPQQMLRSPSSGTLLITWQMWISSFLLCVSTMACAACRSPVTGLYASHEGLSHVAICRCSHESQTCQPDVGVDCAHCRKYMQHCSVTNSSVTNSRVTNSQRTSHAALYAHDQNAAAVASCTLSSLHCSDVKHRNPCDHWQQAPLARHQQALPEQV